LLQPNRVKLNLLLKMHLSNHKNNQIHLQYPHLKLKLGKKELGKSKKNLRHKNLRRKVLLQKVNKNKRLVMKQMLLLVEVWDKKVLSWTY
jgi:hypothetical protein